MRLRHCLLAAPLASALAVGMAFGTAAPVAAEVTDVDDAALARLLDEGVTLVDVRRPDEWADTGVIEGSHLLTFFDAEGNHDAAAWKRELDALLDADEPVALVCRSGRRSSIVARWLDEREGRGPVYDVDGGIQSWLRSGGETAAP